LRCCLAFEEEVYQQMARNLPAIGSVIKTPQGKGKVIGWHTLKQTVDVALEGDEKNIIEILIKKES
jgi:cell fate regulator YaaT (PSP1 superfamily)